MSLPVLTYKHTWLLDSEELKPKEVVWVEIANRFVTAGQVTLHQEGNIRLWVIILLGQSSGGLIINAKQNMSRDKSELTKKRKKASHERSI